MTPQEYLSKPTIEEIEAELRVPRHGRGGVPGEDVHLAGLQGGKAVLRGERNEPHLVGVVEDGGRHRPTELDVETRPVPLCVRQAETRKAKHR